MNTEHFVIPSAPYVSYHAYRDTTGRSAVEQARSMTHDALIDLIDRSGLRGRGGAGFPTGVKWRSVAKHACPIRYVVCNAAEGEPGTFKDRYLIRYNPYALVEGLLIAAHVIGATGAYIAIKASFQREIDRLKKALDEMRDVVGDLPVTITPGPEEYLFGEEKALLSVIEGDGPLPREADDPPYEHGLFATTTSPNPALVNNAQTLALVPGIVRAGSDSFRALGTADTPGTLLVTLCGDIARPGVYEVAAGVTLRALFDGPGKGARKGHQLRAAVSGVSSGVIMADQFDTLLEFSAIAMLGSGLGSAGFIVFDETTSLPRVTQAVTRFLYVESCNQCSACKADLRIASGAIDAMFNPKKAAPDLLERAVLGAQHAPQGNRCYLPVEGAAFVSSMAKRFRGDFLDRIADRRPNDNEYLLPKIVDYDENHHTFLYDTKQPRKQPNWTYLEAAAPAEPARSPTVMPKERAHGPVYARLSPDLGQRLLDIASDEGVDLQDQIDGVLRDWLKRRDSAG